MEGLEALGVGGAIGVLALGLLLWKLFKMALKLVLFVVATAAIALVVVLATANGRVGLPVPSVLPPHPTDIGGRGEPAPLAPPQGGPR